MAERGGGRAWRPGPGDERRLAATSLASLPPAADIPPVTGHVRIRVAPSVDLPWPAVDASGHAADGLPAVVDLGQLGTIDCGEGTVRQIAWRTYTASRVSVIGDDPAAVAYVARALPAALVEAVEFYGEVAA